MSAPCSELPSNVSTMVDNGSLTLTHAGLISDLVYSQIQNEQFIKTIRNGAYDLKAFFKGPSCSYILSYVEFIYVIWCTSKLNSAVHDGYYRTILFFVRSIVLPVVLKSYLVIDICGTI